LRAQNSGAFAAFLSVKNGALFFEWKRRSGGCKRRRVTVIRQSWQNLPFALYNPEIE
jgi:hypothetical protein